VKKAYNIINITKIHDMRKFLAYVTGHIPTLKAYGGKFLVKGDLG